MIKGVIFDVDNTLLDFARMKKIALSESVDAMIDAGLEMSHKKAFKMIHEILDKNGLEMHTLFQKFSRKVYGKINARIVGAAIITHRKVWSGFLHTYPGVVRTLLELKGKGLKLCIVSDANKIHVFERLYASRIVDFFDCVVCHDDTHKFKPARRPFVHALRKVKLKAEECVMVGDWIKGDVLGAQKMGMKGCLAKYGQMSNYSKSISNAEHLKKFKEIKPDYVLKKFSDILKVVDRESKS